MALKEQSCDFFTLLLCRVCITLSLRNTLRTTLTGWDNVCKFLKLDVSFGSRTSTFKSHTCKSATDLSRPKTLTVFNCLFQFISDFFTRFDCLRCNRTFSGFRYERRRHAWTRIHRQAELDLAYNVAMVALVHRPPSWEQSVPTPLPLRQVRNLN